MSIVTCDISVTVDGHAAGPQRLDERPFGEVDEEPFSAGLDTGVRLFDDVGRLTLEHLGSRGTDLVTHVRYRVVR